MEEYTHWLLVIIFLTMFTIICISFIVGIIFKKTIIRKITAAIAFFALFGCMQIILLMHNL